MRFRASINAELEANDLSHALARLGEYYLNLSRGHDGGRGVLLEGRADIQPVEDGVPGPIAGGITTD